MVSIVLLVRDRYALTEQCLHTLYTNTPNDGSWNLVIVDDGTTEYRTKRLLKFYANNNDNCSLVKVWNSGHTLSQLKNLAVAWSEQRFGRGDWLYIGDSDTAFLPGWLEKLTGIAAETESYRFRLWGGQIHPYHQPSGEPYQHQEIEPSQFRRGDSVPVGAPITLMTEHSILDGPSWLMRWETWDECGPFDRTTAPGVCQSEEYGFCERIIRANLDSHNRGGRIGVIHPHVVIHTGLTHLDGSDCVGRKEREAIIPVGILAQ